jgi:hypothetical protein
MPLFRVEIKETIYVEAPYKSAVRDIIREEWDFSGDSIIDDCEVSDEPVTDVSEVRLWQRNHAPWGGDGERTIGEILTEQSTPEAQS